MGFYASLTPPKFASQGVVKGFANYRDAVVWVWENRRNTGAGEKSDQAMCANRINLHTPHMSRCVSRDSGAPMNLSPDLLPGFEAFCGWYAVSQFLATQAQMTLMEQVMEERRAIA